MVANTMNSAVSMATLCASEIASEIWAPTEIGGMTSDSSHFHDYLQDIEQPQEIILCHLHFYDSALHPIYRLELHAIERANSCTGEC
jgi:hypothetical protein